MLHRYIIVDSCSAIWYSDIISEEMIREVREYTMDVIDTETGTELSRDGENWETLPLRISWREVVTLLLYFRRNRMSDVNFEQILAQQNKAYAESEEFGNDWMPPDDGYIVTITKCQKGVLSEDALPWWKLTARIEDPANDKLNGKEFSLGFLSGKVFGIVKSTARALNKGEPVTSISEADGIFDGSVGTVCEVVVKTKADKKGIDRQNCYIQKILDVEAVEAPEETAPPQVMGESS